MNDLKAKPKFLPDAIRSYLLNHPGSSRKEIYSAVPGNNEARNGALASLELDGRIRKEMARRLAVDGAKRLVAIWSLNNLQDSPRKGFKGPGERVDWSKGIQQTC